MFKIRFIALIFLLSALTAGMVYSQDEPVKIICEDMGFYQQFLEDTLTLAGNCDDADGKVSLAATPQGVVLRGFGPNKDIPLKLKDNTTAKAKKIKQFGQKGHKATTEVIATDMISIAISHKNGGSCQATAFAVGAQRCKYEVQNVVASSCSLIGLLDILCGSCKSPCPTYGNNGRVFISIFAAGRPGETCSVKLKRVGRSCRTCTGRSFSIPD